MYKTRHLSTTYVVYTLHCAFYTLSWHSCHLLCSLSCKQCMPGGSRHPEHMEHDIAALSLTSRSSKHNMMHGYCHHHIRTKHLTGHVSADAIVLKRSPLLEKATAAQLQVLIMQRPAPTTLQKSHPCLVVSSARMPLASASR